MSPKAWCFQHAAYDDCAARHSDTTPSALATKLAHAILEEWEYFDVDDYETAMAELLDRAGLAELHEAYSKAYHDGCADAQNAKAWEEKCKQVEAERDALRQQLELWEACNASHKELKERFAPLLHRAEQAEAKLARLQEILRIEARHDTPVRSFATTILAEIDADAKEE